MVQITGTSVLACGNETEPKLGSRVLPGENNILSVVVKNEDTAGVKDILLNLKREHPRTGIRCCILPLEKLHVG